MRIGIDPLPYYRAPAEAARRAGTYPLVLLTAKSALHFLNSSYANLPRHVRAEREPVVDIHGEDAAARGIADGDLVRVESRHGALTL